MKDFTITEDFSKSEIEFDSRFSNLMLVTIICLQQNGRMVLSVKNAAIAAIGPAQDVFLFVPPAITSTH